ncbi:hypothetical protein CANINC_001935 [Pichia inconspicua]|uniref:GST N-terminal domain-containing protein n=1 Tax=Pichia inconspicua TaxID=52247 RepID=A0A4V4NFT9_9ASCO|nr:hypothetical protein CANINC_001935 [[Candida] inconspicua]
MVSGTLYVMSISPRSSWLPALAEFCGHNIKVVEHTDDPNFKSLFPLGKTPAFIADDGEKVTEILAIVEYFIINSPDETKAGFAGKSNKEKVQHLRWMSYINSDFITPLVKMAFSSDDNTKAEGRTQFADQASYIDTILAEGKTSFLELLIEFLQLIFLHTRFCKFLHALVLIFLNTKTLSNTLMQLSHMNLLQIDQTFSHYLYIIYFK